MADLQLSAWQEQMVCVNRAEYGDAVDAMHWVSQAGAVAAETERGQRLKAMEPRLRLAFNATKPHLGPLSPGCRICGEGGWSCLFINGKCNCRCFYCPTPQAEIGVPTTNRISFAQSADYGDYVFQMAFDGVSISGGEPLLTPETTLRFLDSINRIRPRPRHLWMYTNGTLLTADLVKRLKAVGLDEIRFDLSAAQYDTQKIRLAVGHIPVVTVEIPAIPEDFARLVDLLPRLKTLGVNHLNLHQLRMTPYNRTRLVDRGYTFLHGEKVTVLESELTALALMQHVVEHRLDLSVNYCSFVFKNRFQKAAVRRRSARLMAKAHEDVTSSGYIRATCLVGDPERLGRQAEQLSRTGVETSLWAINSAKDRLFFHPSLWRQMTAAGLNMGVTYYEALLCPHISYRRVFKTIDVNREKRIFVEKQIVCREITLDVRQQRRFEALVIHPDGLAHPKPTEKETGFEDYEFIAPGLQTYF
ncbi:Radical SAM domain iron-sulfur cluster-binding oxidoreductase [Desulfosarcina cetonica]|uniref:radical SAM protein n=1 Tax=Desulfosarcina cetonica TaxID=90730 RepID=UPI0006D2075E|nr:radical SAM protein [Desulfosarcina cetonica]VTR64078.1 Radical SAM domain iron-sulfur cluster-binding oxidoreductase [Desulfosarcina cetonica]